MEFRVRVVHYSGWLLIGIRVESIAVQQADEFGTAPSAEFGAGAIDVPLDGSD
jgi:hypothetical protein